MWEVVPYKHKVLGNQIGPKRQKISTFGIKIIHRIRLTCRMSHVKKQETNVINFNNLRNETVSK